MQNSVLAQMCCQFCVADPRDKKSRYSYSSPLSYTTTTHTVREGHTV